MNVQYRHSQPGYLMIVIGLVLIGAGIITAAFSPWPFGIALSGLGAVGVIVFVFGYKLTVEIRDGFLRFWFGPGVFWKNILLEQIAYCEPFKGVIFGWGIHWGPDGWLYNVSGMNAVTIVLKSGKRMHIGTDEPVVLIEAINSAIGRRGGGDTSGMWGEVKADYLKRVEQALSAVRHPQSYEILAEVGNHLDQRFAELGPQERRWEDFQKIITEMGPPSEYAELIGCANKNTKAALSGEYIAILVLILVIVAAGMIILPKVLTQRKVSVVQLTFVNDPELVGRWVSVDLVKEVNEFNPDKRQWQGDFWLKDIEFDPDGTTSLGWISWKKGCVIENESQMSAEYEIKNINGTKYLLLPWLSGDVTIRHQKPEYYILKQVSETSPQQQAKDVQATAAAIEAAKAWLQLVDDGKYDESWSHAAGFLKKFVSEEQLKTSLEAARKPLGKVLSRKVQNSTYTTTLPGAPDGQYVVIQFETSFENKHNAVETVTPMLESDGQWRVSGYYIRRQGGLLLRIRFSFNMLPKLRPGEKVLLFKPWLWFASGKSSPSYRIFLPIPLLYEAGLYITDRRVLLVFYLCRLVILENSIGLLKDKRELEDNEFIEETSAGRNFLLGTYLEIVSEISPIPWYRSHRARLRFFMKDAEFARRVIAEAMT